MLLTRAGQTDMAIARREALGMKSQRAISAAIASIKDLEAV